MKITFIYHKNFSPCINSIFNANAVSEIYILPLSSDAIAPTASHLPNLRGAHLHNLLRHLKVESCHIIPQALSPSKRTKSNLR